MLMEDSPSLAGLGCGPGCRCSACRGLSGFAQAPAGAPSVRTVRVVVKSFIRCIGLSAGSLPWRCAVTSPPGSGARLRALALATDAMMCENPTHDRKDKGYRLFSACTFQVTCQDGKVVSVVPSALDTDTGKEGPLQAPPLITSPVSVSRTADGFTFSWFARGRPHLAAEPPFQLVCPRTSVYIWHRVSGRVRCTLEGTDVSVNLSGSKFPTHRVFVNGTPMQTVPQGGFARLWFPVSLTDPTRVEGLGWGGPMANAAPALAGIPCIYGNWCGPGCSGPGAPIDDVDACCKAHDECYSRRGYSSCSCDRELLNCLAPKRGLTTSKDRAASLIWTTFKALPCVPWR